VEGLVAADLGPRRRRGVRKGPQVRTGRNGVGLAFDRAREFERSPVPGGALGARLPLTNGQEAGEEAWAIELMVGKGLGWASGDRGSR